MATGRSEGRHLFETIEFLEGSQFYKQNWSDLPDSEKRFWENAASSFQASIKGEKLTDEARALK